jgi:hypothetical protein
VDRFRMLIPPSSWRTDPLILGMKEFVIIIIFCDRPKNKMAVLTLVQPHFQFSYHTAALSKADSDRPMMLPFLKTYNSQISRNLARKNFLVFSGQKSTTGNKILYTSPYNE